MINSQKEIKYDKCGVGSYFSEHGQKRVLWAAGPYTEKWMTRWDSHKKVLKRRLPGKARGSTEPYLGMDFVMHVTERLMWLKCVNQEGSGKGRVGEVNMG